MSVIGTTWYSGSYTASGTTCSLGPDNVSAYWPLTQVSGTTNKWYKKFLIGGHDVYRYANASAITLFYTNFYMAADFKTKTGAVSITPYTVYAGSRLLTVACSAGGSVTSPSIAENSSIVAVTRPSGDMAAATNVLTVVAANGLPANGTLRSRGDAAGVWVNWTWPSAVLTSSSQTIPGVATAQTITLSLLAGTDDATITANYTREPNSASAWSPAGGKVIVHLSNDSLVETETSLTAVGNSSQWTTFRAKGFTALGCTSGAETIDWYQTVGGYTTPAYLMNVSAATFTVAPITGKRVYAWKLQKADGTYVDFGSGTSAAISGFEEGCKVHLYLTSASPYPRLSYDGFDSTSPATVPANQNVLVSGASFAVGKVWTSPNASPLSLTLSPVAWATRSLNQTRSVLIDGAETPLANVAGTSAGVLSSAAPFSLGHLKFKQVPLASDGVLTVSIITDTIAAIGGVSVGVVQEAVTLATITAAGTAGLHTTTGTAGYYQGAEAMVVDVAIDYGAANPANFTVSVIPAVFYDEDGFTTDGKPKFQAVTAARAVTVRVTQVVTVGSLDSVDVNLTRDVSIGTQIATSAGPITQSYAGSVSVTMVEDQSSAMPLYIECSVMPGYTLKSLRVLSADGTKTYTAVPAPTTVTPIYINVPWADDGVDLKVVLVVAAEILGTPIIAPRLPDDLGKFAATVTSVGGYGDFRVGDAVLLEAAPIVISTAMTGVAIGNPFFNGVEISPVRTAAAVAATVTLARGDNLFEIPVYAALETGTAPAGAGTPTVTMSWDVEDTLTISAVVYRRLGSVFTATVPLTSTGYTAISAKISRRAVTAGFAYVEVGALLPTVASVSTRSFTAILRGPTECIAVYAIGADNPKLVCAAYDYGAAAYITQGVRPSVTFTPVAPATLGDNYITTVSWTGVTTPGTEYKAAAFLIRAVPAGTLLPGVTYKITSSVAARLEMWNATTSAWTAYSPEVVTLSEAYTFFRVSVGDPPENLVAVSFEEAVTADSVGVPGCSVYATSGAAYDGNFVLPATLQARSRTVLHARVTPPYGYIVTGWYVNNVLQELNGASLSIVVPDTGLTLKPQVAVRVVAALAVMVLNADPNQTDEGVWVSKLFRSQYPWKPLTAAVVAKPPQNPVTLAVFKDGGPAPESIDTENPGTVAITLTGDTMRRLPAGQIQKSRFVRYMVVVTGDVSVSSVAVGSGADTLKGGH